MTSISNTSFPVILHTGLLQLHQIFPSFFSPSTEKLCWWNGRCILCPWKPIYLLECCYFDFSSGSVSVACALAEVKFVHKFRQMIQLTAVKSNSFAKAGILPPLCSLLYKPLIHQCLLDGFDKGLFGPWCVHWWTVKMWYLIQCYWSASCSLYYQMHKQRPVLFTTKTFFCMKIYNLQVFGIILNLWWGCEMCPSFVKNLFMTLPQHVH